MSQKLHELKIKHIEKKLQSQGMSTKKQFPILLRDKKKHWIDIVGFDEKGCIGVEVETDLNSLQAKENRLKLNKLREAFGCKTCQYDLVTSKCY